MAQYQTNRDKILAALRSRKKGVTANELALKTNCEPNSVYATISKLRAEGFQITATKKKGATHQSYMMA